MNAPPQHDGIVEFDNEPPKAELKSCRIILIQKFFRFFVAQYYIFISKRLNHHRNWNLWQQTNHYVQKCLTNGALKDPLSVLRIVFERNCQPIRTHFFWNCWFVKKLVKVWTKNSIKYILSRILPKQESRICSWFNSNCSMSRSTHSISCNAKGTRTIRKMWWSRKSSKVG